MTAPRTPRKRAKRQARRGLYGPDGLDERLLDPEPDPAHAPRGRGRPRGGAVSAPEWTALRVRAYLRCGLAAARDEAAWVRLIALETAAGPGPADPPPDAPRTAGQALRYLTRDLARDVLALGSPVSPAGRATRAAVLVSWLAELEAVALRALDPLDGLLTAAPPEAAASAAARLEAEVLAPVRAWAGDPRLTAVAWALDQHGCPPAWAWTDGEGRPFRHRADAVGVATAPVPAFGRGPDGAPADLAAGDVVVLSLEADARADLSGPALRHRLDLAWSVALVRADPRWAGRPVRAFVAALADGVPSARPRDPATGEVISATVARLNPAYRAAVGALTDRDAETSKRRPKDATGAPIPKWLEEPDPRWLEASQRPRGPVFRAADVDVAQALATTRAAVVAAEAGLAPASGVWTGACRSCPYRGTCSGDPAERAEDDDGR